MNHPPDSQLLRDYAENRAEAAFAELVRRHVDLVYSAALRMVRDPHLAEDVTQGVFVALTKNAGPLADRPVLSGWLHRTAQNIAAQTVRTIERRRAREQEAVAMNELLAADSEVSWDHIAPHLDAALGELSEPDRDALLLRYFERQSARDMALTLGISDEAAQKRVSRAIERLRENFAKRGVTAGAGGLAVVITANAVQAAPVGLALTISTAAVLTGTTLAATATVTATKAIAMTALQKTLVTAIIAVLAGAGIYQARLASQLRDQVQTLQQQQAPLVEQIAQLNQAFIDATNRLDALRSDNDRLNQNTGELLRLRGEVGVLRRQLATQQDIMRPTASIPAARVTTKGHTPGEYITKTQLQFVGYDTPESAIESITWAMMNGTLEQANEGLGPGQLNSSPPSQQAKDQFKSRQNSLAPLFKGLQVVSRKDIADDQVELKMKMDPDPIPGQHGTMPAFLIQPMTRVNGQWKISDSTREYSENWEKEGQIQTFVIPP